jgi:hypothetical protein
MHPSMILDTFNPDLPRRTGGYWDRKWRRINHQDVGLTVGNSTIDVNRHLYGYMRLQLLGDSEARDGDLYSIVIKE